MSHLIIAFKKPDYRKEFEALTPAERLERATELTESGRITKEEALDLVFLPPIDE